MIQKKNRRSGNYYATPYANSPFTTHTFSPFLTGTYSKSSTGTGTGRDTTFAFSFSESQLSTLAIANGAAGWEGFGYPFDNGGDTTGNATTPYRMGLWGRFYLDGALTVNVEPRGDVTWDVIKSDLVGTIDLVHDFNAGPTTVPEPMQCHPVPARSHWLAPASSPIVRLTAGVLKPAAW